LGKENRTPGALCDEISRKVSHCTATKNFVLVEELNKRYGRSWQTETAVNALNGIQENLNEIDKLSEEISLLVK
jgi:hypothetical protein